MPGSRSTGTSCAPSSTSTAAWSPPASGRDYAIDFRKDKAIFAVFRRTSEMPLYRIEKDPKLARRQGAYCVIAASGLVMKRGQELWRVLQVLEGKALRVVD